jgi:ElaB/YqjD/DUF883 family membrane-anchored ribosome-binding protein
LDNNQINNQIDDYTKKGQEYIENTETKASELLSKANGVVHDVVDKTSELSQNMGDMFKKKDSSEVNNYTDEYYSTSYGCLDETKTTVDYVKDYAKQHPVITATAASATVLTGVSLISPKTRKITVPVAKYAVKQQAKFTLGLGMLAMASYLSNKNNHNAY